jgi:hypothetical protein
VIEGCGVDDARPQPASNDAAASAASDPFIATSQKFVRRKRIPVATIGRQATEGYLAGRPKSRAKEDVAMFFSSIALRRISVVAVAAVTLSAIAVPGQAQMRQQMAVKVATTAGNEFVSKINGETCSQFAATMAQMKGKSGSSSSGMASKLKANAQARSAFVNIVGGPLLNKMIDCDMLPGGM